MPTLIVLHLTCVTRSSLARPSFSHVCPLLSNLHITYFINYYNVDVFLLFASSLSVTCIQRRYRGLTDVSSCVYSVNCTVHTVLGEFLRDRRCYNEFCDPPYSVSPGGAVAHFLQHARVWSVDRHEVDVHYNKNTGTQPPITALTASKLVHENHPTLRKSR